MLPLLDFVQELPENRLSEVIGQSVGHIVSNEGIYDSLSGKKKQILNANYFYLTPYANIADIIQNLLEYY